MAQLLGFQHFLTHFGNFEKLKQKNTYVFLVPKQPRICIFISLFNFVLGFFLGTLHSVMGVFWFTFVQCKKNNLQTRLS